MMRSAAPSRMLTWADLVRTPQVKRLRASSFRVLFEVLSLDTMPRDFSARSLAAASGIHPNTVIRAMKDLKAAGLVAESKDCPSRGGHPTYCLQNVARQHWPLPLYEKEPE